MVYMLIATSIPFELLFELIPWHFLINSEPGGSYQGFFVFKFYYKPIYIISYNNLYNL